MSANHFQKELFEDFENQRKPSLRRFQAIVPLASSVNIPVERIVFAGIGVIMAMVVMFALGVEKGKTAAVREVQEPEKPARAAESVVVMPEPRLKPVIEIGVLEPNQADTTPVDKPGTPEPLYTIQAVTFKTRSAANRAIKSLENDGYQPYVKASGDYLQVCVGRYPTKQEAENDRAKLLKTFGDCYIKKVDQ
ncbi:MAG: SPOR domain-containing protein [Candidatus Omnitrophota bacterium]